MGEPTGVSPTFREGVAAGKLAKRHRIVIPVPNGLTKRERRDYMRGVMAELDHGKAK